jgi:cyclopropane fatty-acyl-phospholipid synthase-like methyltransferase
MHYYHETKNAESYAAMCEGYDAAIQLEMLYKELTDGAVVLELGSGPGNDLELLASHYQVTGSDYSPAFVDILKTRFAEQSILTLDAKTIATTKLFDAIYSNKVLHHLNDDDLAASFCRQAQLLSPGGLVFHLVWRSLEAPQEDNGLIYEARDAATMKTAMGNSFELVESGLFGEFEEGDSLAILARKT